MKKYMKNLIVRILLFTLVFTGFTHINDNKSDVHQYNYNPEKTNTRDLLGYKLMLDGGVITEEYVFVDITEYNNLTDQGVQDLINAGYLHSYIPALIEAGRLPEGFTPVASNNTPKPSESEKEPESQKQEETPKPSVSETPDSSNTQTQKPESEAVTPNPAPADKEEESSVPDEKPDKKPDSSTSQNKPQTNTEGKNPATESSITCDTSVSGTYVVVSENTKGYASYKTSSKVSATYNMGEEVTVTALTSNDFYQVAKDDTNVYVKKEHLVEKETYDTAWKELSKTESTCITEGSILYTNTITGETKVVVTNKADHSMVVTESIPATCKKEGSETITCSVCGEKQIKKTAAMHKEGKLETVKKAGLFLEGKKESKCLSCGEIITTQTIPSKLPPFVLYAIILLPLAGAGAVFYFLKVRKKKK